MGTNWFVAPATVRLPLSEGHWVDVKKRLTVGETRKAIASLAGDIAPDGRPVLNLEMVGKSDLIAYILAWSLRDDVTGEPVPYEPAALDGLDPDRYKEIDDAVQAHIKAQQAERDAEKKSKGGEKQSSATSPSAG